MAHRRRTRRLGPRSAQPGRLQEAAGHLAHPQGTFHAHRVSDLLQVSKQAVWLWIKQYNQGGPDSLDRKGRGGRRRAYLSLDQERMLVERLQQQVAKGQARKAKELLPEVLGRRGTERLRRLRVPPDAAA